MDDHTALRLKLIIESAVQAINENTEIFHAAVIKLTVNIMECDDWLDSNITFVLDSIKWWVDSKPAHAECNQYIKEKKEN